MTTGNGDFRQLLAVAARMPNPDKTVATERRGALGAPTLSGSSLALKGRTALRLDQRADSLSSSTLGMPTVKTE
jgi:hypothetical protein